MLMIFSKLMDDFYCILRNLPNYGKVMAMASLATLYLAINPMYETPVAIYGQYNRVVERNGKLDFTLPPMFVKKFPQDAEYINTGRKPQPGEEFAIIKTDEKDGSHKYYLYKHAFGHSHSEWKATIKEYRKTQSRKKMTASFLFSVGICLASYPGLIRRMLNLIPKK